MKQEEINLSRSTSSSSSSWKMTTSLYIKNHYGDDSLSFFKLFSLRDQTNFYDDDDKYAI